MLGSTTGSLWYSGDGGDSFVEVSVEPAADPLGAVRPMDRGRTPHTTRPRTR